MDPRPGWPGEPSDAILTREPACRWAPMRRPLQGNAPAGDTCPPEAASHLPILLPRTALAGGLLAMAGLLLPAVPRAEDGGAGVMACFADLPPDEFAGRFEAYADGVGFDARMAELCARGDEAGATALAAEVEADSCGPTRWPPACAAASPGSPRRPAGARARSATRPGAEAPDFPPSGAPSKKMRIPHFRGCESPGPTLNTRSPQRRRH